MASSNGRIQCRRAATRIWSTNSGLNVAVTSSAAVRASPAMTANATAVPTPLIRRAIARQVLGFGPPFLNPGAGSNRKTIPVYDSVNSSKLTDRRPLAGSLR